MAIEKGHHCEPLEVMPEPSSWRSSRGITANS